MNRVSHLKQKAFVTQNNTSQAFACFLDFIELKQSGVSIMKEDLSVQ